MSSDAKTCVFCQIVRGEATPGVIAYRDAETAVFPTRGQTARNRGHMLVVPTPDQESAIEKDDVARCARHDASFREGVDPPRRDALSDVLGSMTVGACRLSADARIRQREYEKVFQYVDLRSTRVSVHVLSR